MSGIEVQGLDELDKLFHDIEITEQKEKKALKLALDLYSSSAKNSAPRLTGHTEKSIKSKIGRHDGNLAAITKVNAWDAIFGEYGSSKNKKYVGWFSNAVDNTTTEAINIVKEIILK